MPARERLGRQPLGHNRHRAARDAAHANKRGGIRRAQTGRFTGTLRGGIVAVGAETTGWVLESEEHGRLDVDVSKMADAAGDLDGMPVVIEGTLVKVNWVERGEKNMLMADAIRAADGG